MIAAEIGELKRRRTTGIPLEDEDRTKKRKGGFEITVLSSDYFKKPEVERGPATNATKPLDAPGASGNLAILRDNAGLILQEMLSIQSKGDIDQSEMDAKKKVLAKSGYEQLEGLLLTARKEMDTIAHKSAAEDKKQAEAAEEWLGHYNE